MRTHTIVSDFNRRLCPCIQESHLLTARPVRVPSLVSLPADIRWRPDQSHCTDKQIEAQAWYFLHVHRTEKSLMGFKSISLPCGPSLGLLFLRGPGRQLCVGSHTFPRPSTLEQKMCDTGGVVGRAGRLGLEACGELCRKLGLESGKSICQQHLWERAGRMGWDAVCRYLGHHSWEEKSTWLLLGFPRPSASLL